MVYPQQVRPEAQAERIMAMERDPGRYEDLGVSGRDHEVCKELGYPKGALCKFREVGTGAIHTFCSLEVLVKTRHTPSPEDRPFPQTYGDWVDLSSSIKEKTPVGAHATVNNLLQIIHEGGPEAEEAKRWLVKKAGELSIT